jgi:hypothetical protein
MNSDSAMYTIDMDRWMDVMDGWFYGWMLWMDGWMDR